MHTLAEKKKKTLTCSHTHSVPCNHTSAYFKLFTAPRRRDDVWNCPVKYRLLSPAMTHDLSLSPLCSGSFQKLHLCWRLLVWKTQTGTVVAYRDQPKCFSNWVQPYFLMPQPHGQSICCPKGAQSPLTQVWRHHGWPAPRSAFSPLIHTDRPNADH